MDLCHQRSVDILKLFIASVTDMKYTRALDVAGGDGRISKALLLKHFHKVDLFDQCPIAVEKAAKTMSNHRTCGKVVKGTM